MSSVSITPTFLPGSKVSVTSSSNQLGDQGEDCILEVKFQPQHKLAPTGEGQIEIGLPTLWQLSLDSENMYDADVQDQCNSDCLAIYSSRLQGNLINIKFRYSNCVLGEKITIFCKYFRNPIYQDQWHGFFVNTYDNEKPSAAIEMSDSTYLDAVDFLPSIITKRNFLVQPDDNVISTESEWLFTLEPQIPMEQGCYIRLWMPVDI